MGYLVMHRRATKQKGTPKEVKVLVEDAPVEVALAAINGALDESCWIYVQNNDRNFAGKEQVGA